MEIVLYQIHLASCLFMTGLIWVIQLVHYPSFSYIDRSTFSNFCTFHQSRITVIVAPVMLAEATTALALIWTSGNQTTYWINLLTVVAIWFVTFFFSVPEHQKLSKGLTEDSIRRLVATNWMRTFLWTARSLALLINL